VPIAADAGLAATIAELSPGAEIPEATYETVAALLHRIGGWPRGRSA
jgi:type III secretion system FlhB-like substrate exporter